MALETTAPSYARRRGRMPPTRYQGSKRRFMDWIGARLDRLEFDTALDAFGGSGVVAHWLKGRGKEVVYNDLLSFNYQIGLALIENDEVTLDEGDLARIVTPDPDRQYDDFIQRTFGGIYDTDAENHWVDVVVQNIRRIPCRATAWSSAKRTRMGGGPSRRVPIFSFCRRIVTGPA